MTIFFTSEFDVTTFQRFYGEYVQLREMGELQMKSSLKVYNTFWIKKGKQNYLTGVGDFNASRLKMLARTGCLSLNVTLNRMKIKEFSKCTLCNLNEDESIGHFLIECPTYVFRNECYNSIDQFAMEFLGGLDFSELPHMCQMQFLIGDYGYFYDDNVGKFFDVVGKSLLLKCFNLRKNLLNEDV